MESSNEASKDALSSLKLAVYSESGQTPAKRGRRSLQKPLTIMNLFESASPLTQRSRMKFLFLFALVLVGCFAAEEDAKKANMKLYRKYMDTSRKSRAQSLEAQAKMFSGAKKYKWLGPAQAQTDQANQLSKLSSYQGQRIKADLAYEKYMDVMAKEDAKARDIYRARDGYRSQNLKSNYKMLEINGASHEKQGTIAALLAYQMTQVNHDLQEDAYYFALDKARADREDEDLRRAVRKADRSLRQKRNLKNSQMMHFAGNKQLGYLLERQAHQNIEYDLEVAIDKAASEFREARTRENRMKLEIAEMTLQANEQMKTHFMLNLMGQDISTLVKVQASQLKAEIADMKEELAFGAFRTARGPVPMSPYGMPFRP